MCILKRKQLLSVSIFFNFTLNSNSNSLSTDGAAGGTLARVLAAGSTSGFGTGTTTKRSSLTRSVTPNHLGLSSLTLSSVGVSYNVISGTNIGGGPATGSQDNGQAENLAQDMSDLMHDFDVVSRIASLIGTLRGKYDVSYANNQVIYTAINSQCSLTFQHV